MHKHQSEMKHQHWFTARTTIPTVMMCPLNTLRTALWQPQLHHTVMSALTLPQLKPRLNLFLAKDKWNIRQRVEWFRKDWLQLSRGIKWDICTFFELRWTEGIVVTFFLFYLFSVRILKYCSRYLSSNTLAFSSAALLCFILVIIISSGNFTFFFV